MNSHAEVKIYVHPPGQAEPTVYFLNLSPLTETAQTHRNESEAISVSCPCSENAELAFNCLVGPHPGYGSINTADVANNLNDSVRASVDVGAGAVASATAGDVAASSEVNALNENF